MSSVALHTFWDASVAVPWAASNVLLVRSAVRLCDAASPGLAGADRVLDVCVVYCGAVVFVLTVLGALGLFSGPAMLAGVGILASGASTLLRTVGINEMRLSRPELRINGVATFGWVLASGLLCGHVVVNGLLRLPTDFDCLMYHMPLVDHWLQAKSLYAPESAHWSLAGNSELLAAWMIGPFSGDFLVALNNVPVVVVWAAAAVALARGLGMSGAWPHLSAFATLNLHTLLHETDDASNDLMVGAFCLAGAAYTVRFLSSGRRADLILFGVSAGLLAGVKFFALGYAALCLGVFGGGLVLQRGWRAATLPAAVAAVVGTPFGVYWYARNLIVAGLPLYPLGANSDQAGQIRYPDIWSTSFWGNGHPELLELGMGAVWRMGGPVHLLAVAAAPAVAVLLLSRGLWLGGGAKRGSAEAQNLTLIAAWLIGSGAVLIATPFAVEDQPGTLNHLKWAYTPARYGLCFLSFAVLAGCLLLDRASERRGACFKNVVLFALVLLCLWQVAFRISRSSEFDFAAAAIVGIDVSLLMLVFVKLSRLRTFLGRSALHTLSFLALAALPGAAASLSQRWHEGFAAHFDRFFQTTIFSQAEARLPREATAVVFVHRPYAFFGSARQHKVHQPWSLISRRWLDALLEEGRPDLVVVEVVGSEAVNRYRGALAVVDAHPGYAPVGRPGHFQVFAPVSEAKRSLAVPRSRIHAAPDLLLLSSRAQSVDEPGR